MAAASRAAHDKMERCGAAPMRFMLIGILAAEAVLAFCTLAFELAMTRLVAPHAGMSTDTWTAIIAAFLIAWALGNHVGGMLAARASVAQMLMRAAGAAALGALLALAVPGVLSIWDRLVLEAAPLQTWRIVLFSGLPPLPVGFCFGLCAPLLLTALIRLSGGSGIAIGLANAMGAGGSVLGALAVLWILLDDFGTRGTVRGIALLAFAAAALLLVLALRQHRREVPR